MQNLEWVRVEEVGTSPAGALVSNEKSIEWSISPETHKNGKRRGRTTEGVCGSGSSPLGFGLVDMPTRTLESEELQWFRAVTLRNSYTAPPVL